MPFMPLRYAIFKNILEISRRFADRSVSVFATARAVCRSLADESRYGVWCTFWRRLAANDESTWSSQSTGIEEKHYGLP